MTLFILCWTVLFMFVGIGFMRAASKKWFKAIELSNQADALANEANGVIRKYMEQSQSDNEAAKRLSDVVRLFVVNKNKEVEDAQQQALNVAIELGESDLLLIRQQYLIEAWKSYALAYEVLCETSSEQDLPGAKNASAAVSEARRVLESMGEYSM
jgi:hypothetical protein